MPVLDGSVRPQPPPSESDAAARAEKPCLQRCATPRDHPGNPGYPTYWHARGYGLFAANNLGQNAFDPKQPEMKRTIAPGESMTFRHRVMIVNGPVEPARMNAEHQKFSTEK